MSATVTTAYHPQLPPWLQAETRVKDPPIPPERLCHLARQIHPLGERALYELLCELAAGAPLLPRLERYAALSPYRDFLLATGGDRLSPPTVIAGRR
jgi:hypothetical protein